MVIGRRSNGHNSAILQAIEVKQTLLNFFFDSLSNDTKLSGFGWKNAKSAGLPTVWLVTTAPYQPALLPSGSITKICEWIGPAYSANLFSFGTSVRRDGTRYIMMVWWLLLSSLMFFRHVRHNRTIRESNPRFPYTCKSTMNIILMNSSVHMLKQSKNS